MRHSSRGIGTAKHVVSFVLVFLSLTVAIVLWLRSSDTDEPLPRAPEAKASVVKATSRAPGESSLTSIAPNSREAERLWRLATDENHLVRGLALEALQKAGLGVGLDPDRVRGLRTTSTTDTDFNRRGACALMLQYSVPVGLEPASELYEKTRNENTRTTLIEVLRKVEDPRHKALLRDTATATRDSPARRLARAALEAEPTRQAPGGYK